MNQSTTKDQILSIAQYQYRAHLRRSVGYLKLLQTDLEEGMRSLGGPASQEEKRTTFQRLMTLTLGSSDSWKRLERVVEKIDLPTSVIERYVLRRSAPVAVLQSMLLETVYDILTEECRELESILILLEQEEQRVRESEKAEWKAFRERTETVLPNNWLNCAARFAFAQKDEVPVELLFAYPCRGVYDLTEYSTAICTVCADRGKECSHAHGRVLLSSEDGLLLLPHIISTQADLLQVIADIKNANAKKHLLSFADAPQSFDDCVKFLKSNPVVQSLPSGNLEVVQTYDLSVEQLVWHL